MVCYGRGISSAGKINGVETEISVAVCVERVDGGVVEDCLVSYFVVVVVAAAFILFLFMRISFVCCRSVILIFFTLYFLCFGLMYVTFGILFVIFGFMFWLD